MKANTNTSGSLFELRGRPPITSALPLALQHVVAMIVGCVTPAIIVASAVSGGGMADADKIILIQSSLSFLPCPPFCSSFP